VVAGTSNSSFALARFNADGTLDTTFNSRGQVVTNFPVPAQTINAITIQSDGKIVVAGSASTSKDVDIMLARYTPDGSLDSAFGTDGFILTDLGKYETPKALLSQADGRLLVAGSKKNGVLEYYESDIFIVGYHSDGSLDEKFGEAGKVITSFGKYEDIYSAVLQTDGKIVVAGTSGMGNPLIIYTLADFLAVRYNPDGSLDKDFGDGGKITTDFGRVEIARDLTVDKDGNIILAGYSGNWTPDGFEQSDFAIARYIGITPKPLPDFALSTEATTITAARGSKIKLPIQIDHLNGFTGNITLTAPNTENLKIVIPEPVQTTAGTSVRFTLKVKKGTPAGSHQLIFTGKDESGKEHVATVTLVIQ
jgi:serralysin